MHPYLKNTLIALAICFVVLFAGIFGVVKYIKSEQGKKEQANAVNVEMIRSKIEKALEAKYELDFDVETPQLQGNEGFGYDTMGVKVWTTGAERFAFGAQWVISEDKLDYDSYISAKMGHEAWKIWEPKLRAYYGDDFSVEYYSFGLDSDFTITNYKELKDLNVEEILRSYPEKFRLELQFLVKTDQFNLDKEALRIYELTRWFGEKELSKMVLIATLVLPNKEREYLEKVSQGRIDDKKMYEDGTLINVFRIRSFEEYNTLEAIKNSLWFGKPEE